MDALCFGIIVLDHRHRPDQESDPAHPLRLVEQALRLEIGGVPIVAVNLARLGLRTGIMGAVGQSSPACFLSEHRWSQWLAGMANLGGLAIPT